MQGFENGAGKGTGATQAREEETGKVRLPEGDYFHLDAAASNPTVGIGERVQGAAPRARWRTDEGDDARAAGEIWNEGNKKINRTARAVLEYHRGKVDSTSNGKVFAHSSNNSKHSV